MKVPTYDHARTFRRLRVPLTEAFERVLGSGVLDWGPEVPALEAAFARELGVAHAVSTNSGTAALKAALLALGVGPGDEVVTVPNSDVSTTSAVHHVGATAVWVDVEADTMNMDPAALEAAIGPRTRAIVPVHLYGHPADMPAITEIAAARGVPVLEDACLALGARVDDVPVGAWGAAAAFSFAPTKHLGAFGSGGVTVTDDPELAERMEMHAAYGQPRERHIDPTRPARHRVDGLNERLDELQAALLRVKLPHLDAWLRRRTEHAEVYASALAGLPVVPPATRPGSVHAWRNYVLRTDRRDALRDHLRRAGVATGTPYAPPLHLQPAFRRYGAAPGAFPETERAAATLVALPIAPELTSEQIAYAAAQVRAFFE